jgi:alanine racemase
MAYITLNKNNFFNNLETILKKTKSVDKIALVLKDNAYGHGLLEMSKLAKEFGVKKAVVRCEVEALHVEKYFEYILILSDTPNTPKSKFHYTINDIDSIEKFAKGTKVELKVDTSMHRNGISISQLKEAFERIKKASLELKAVFTHHRSADELSSEWFVQNQLFKDVKTKSKNLAKEFGFDTPKFHSANSASLFRHTDFDEDMARVGIAAYGCMQSEASLDIKALKPVLSLYAQKISSRVLKAGERIGYGATYTMKEDGIVSNYDFGYADGFLRLASNNYTTPNSEQLLGRISMDNSSFLSNKDEILVFDDARKLAKSAQTIGYEVLTSLKPYIKRVYV